MDRLTEILHVGGGAAHVATLRRAGIRPGVIASAVESGRVRRLRTGLIARPDLPAEVVRAARAGGRLAGDSAARHHGLWSVGRRLVVALPEHTGRVWDPDVAGIPLSPGDPRVLIIRDLEPAPRFGVSDIRRAIREVALTEATHHLIALGDSALRRTSILPFDLMEIDALLPPRTRGSLLRCDGRPESGTESILRELLLRVGIHAECQPRLPISDLARGDLLIGDRLIVECDSEAHHGWGMRRRSDLERDAALAALGYIVLRFDYRQIVDDPELVVAAIRSYVDAGLHLSH